MRRSRREPSRVVFGGHRQLRRRCASQHARPVRHTSTTVSTSSGTPQVTHPPTRSCRRHQAQAAGRQDRRRRPRPQRQELHRSRVHQPSDLERSGVRELQHDRYLDQRRVPRGEVHVARREIPRQRPPCGRRTCRRDPTQQSRRRAVREPPGADHQPRARRCRHRHPRRRWPVQRTRASQCSSRSRTGTTGTSSTRSARFGHILRHHILSGTSMPTSTYDGVNGITHRNDLAGLNLTKVPLVLIECGNMRNATDARLMTSTALPEAACACVHSGDRRVRPPPRLSGA